jgi:DNA invertase Pin-like site-specific DNA recombinase
MAKKGAAPVPGVTTALIYTRVSSDEQAREGLSLDAQLSECRRYAAARGWVIGYEFQDVLSGKRDDRRAYQALLRSVRQLRAEGRSVAVVVAALDRFGRNLLERVRCREELKSLGVPTHSAREGGEVSDIVANILAAVAEEEVRRLGERIRASNRHIAAGGWHHLGRSPWGYFWRAATSAERSAGSPKSVLEVDEVVAPYVSEAFDRLARGDSIRSVANWLARLPERARAGRQMRYSAVHVILQLRTYIGQFEDGRSGRWPALVDPDIWQRAQDAIAQHKYLPKQASRAYLLTGFLRCERCASRMSGWHQRGRPLRYRCQGNQQGAASPDFRCYQHMRCVQVDQPLLNQLAGILEALTAGNRRFVSALRRRWEATLEESDNEGGAATIRHLEHEAERARERLTKAAIFLVDGTIDKVGYARLRDTIQRDLDATETELARFRETQTSQPELPSLDEVLAKANGWQTILAGGDIAMCREVLTHLVRTVTPRRLMRDTFSLEIGWTPLGEALRQVVAAKVA